MSAEREAREAMASAVAMLVDGAVNQVPDVEQDRREKEYDRRVRAYCAAIETRVRAAVDAEWRARVRPMLSVGDSEDGERWCLWLIPTGTSGEAAECIPAVYARYATDEEEERINAGVAEWGPGVEEMLAEWITAVARDREGL